MQTPAESEFGKTRELRTLTKEGQPDCFYYAFASYGDPIYPGEWEFRVSRENRWVQDGQKCFRFRVMKYPKDTGVLLVTYQYKEQSGPGGCGIPYAMLPELARLFHRDVISSRDGAPEPWDKLSEGGAKVYWRLTDWGIAEPMLDGPDRRYRIRLEVAQRLPRDKGVGPPER